MAEVKDIATGLDQHGAVLTESGHVVKFLSIIKARLSDCHGHKNAESFTCSLRMILDAGTYAG